MNAVSPTFISLRLRLGGPILMPQLDDLATMTSAGYSPGTDAVNASDRPLADEGQGSSGAEASGVAPQAHGHYPKIQKASFRADLLLPYGHLFA